jgi:hypothetical protein
VAAEFLVREFDGQIAIRMFCIRLHLFHFSTLFSLFRLHSQGSCHRCFLPAQAPSILDQVPVNVYTIILNHFCAFSTFLTGAMLRSTFVLGLILNSIYRLLSPTRIQFGAFDINSRKASFSEHWSDRLVFVTRSFPYSQYNGECF